MSEIYSSILIKKFLNTIKLIIEKQKFEHVKENDMFKKALTTTLALVILTSTATAAFAYGPYNDGYYNPQYNEGYYNPQYNQYYNNQPTAGQQVKKAVKYGAIGAVAGTLINSGHRGRGAWEGAAIGAGAGLLFGK